ncbi:unnamed protein product, partial [Discosporangium mesarthrocarpum]
AVLVLVLSILSTSAGANEICNVNALVTSTFGKDGPLQGCEQGDIAHFQVDTTLVAWSNIVARYCDFDRQILVEHQPGGNIDHVVCSYKWKWAKDVTMDKHPDSQ